MRVIARTQLQRAIGSPNFTGGNIYRNTKSFWYPTPVFISTQCMCSRTMLGAIGRLLRRRVEELSWSCSYVAQTTIVTPLN